MSSTQIAAWIGLDWGDRRHWVCLQVEGSDQVENEVLEQRPDHIHQWVAKLRQRFGGRPVALALEQSRGPLIYALMEYDFLILYPINPKQLARYRQAFRVSGAKDDPSDAQLVLDLLRRHHHQLSAWQPEDVLTRSFLVISSEPPLTLSPSSGTFPLPSPTHPAKNERKRRGLFSQNGLGCLGRAILSGSKTRKLVLSGNHINRS